MSDPVDLAGVIGTWMAVFLALVALLGLLPGYLLYKRSRSENAAAIAAIDDPRHKFVSGIRIFGVILTQKFKIPDLSRAPPLAALENATLDNIPSERVSGPGKSETAWVQFAQLIMAVFPDFELGGKNLLSFANGEARLPVHKTWLIALGILHRYSLRLDHGLPLGATVDAATDGGLIQEARLSGLSGFNRGGSEKVIASIKSKELRENFLRVLTGIDVKAKRELSLELIPVPKEIETDSHPGEATASIMRRHGYYRLGFWHQREEEFEVWIRKEDAHFFVLAYLEQRPSPYGFLFDVQQDLVVRRMLKTNTVGALLDLATLWCQELPEKVLREDLRTRLRKVLEEMSRNDLLALQWSRRVMHEIVSLDEALSVIAQPESVEVGNKDIMWNAIRAKYACDEEFQQSMRQYLTEVNLDVGNGSQAGISIDIGGGAIKVPGEDGAEFPFDFKLLFPEQSTTPKDSGATASITPVLALFACLQGQLRAIAWKMSLNPAYMDKLDDKIRDTCYLSMRSFHGSSARYSVSRRRSSDSWRTHDVETGHHIRRIVHHTGEIRSPWS